MKSNSQALYYFSMFILLFVIFVFFYFFNKYSYNMYIDLNKLANNYVEEFISGK